MGKRKRSLAVSSSQDPSFSGLNQVWPLLQHQLPNNSSSPFAFVDNCNVSSQFCHQQPFCNSTKMTAPLSDQVDYWARDNHIQGLLIHGSYSLGNVWTMEWSAIQGICLIKFYNVAVLFFCFFRYTSEMNICTFNLRECQVSAVFWKLTHKLSFLNAVLLCFVFICIFSSVQIVNLKTFVLREMVWPFSHLGYWMMLMAQMQSLELHNLVEDNIVNLLYGTVGCFSLQIKKLEKKKYRNRSNYFDLLCSMQYRI